MKENYPAVHRSIRKKFPIKNVILITNQDNKDSNSLAQKYIVLPLLRRYSNDVSSVTMDNLHHQRKLNAYKYCER